MSKVKTEHYVPQFYLKRFTQDGKSIFVFDKFNRKVFRSNVSSVASEKYFYDFPDDPTTDDGIDPQIVEKALADLEARFSNTLDVLLEAIEKGKRAIERDPKLAMAHFLTIQLLRTKEFREFLIEQMEKFGEALLVKTPDYSSDQYWFEVNKEWVSLFQSSLMFDSEALEPFIRVLYNHIWFVGTNKTAQPFYTSDNPVVKRAHYTHPLRSYSGLASEGIEIAFPLNSQYVLVLCERTAFRRYAKFDCKSMVLNADNITYYNHLQVVHSYRWIYCTSDDFSLAEKMCCEHPEICSPDRARVQVS